MAELVILLEEPSAKEMLLGIISRIVPADIEVRLIPFQGKQDLEKNVCRKMRGYQNTDACFLIIRDQDSGECRKVKQKLVDECAKSGRPRYKVRILCHELETVYLADLAAVENGLKISGLSENQQKKNYRNPDALGNPKQKLKDLTENQYSDIAGSRAIGPFLDLDNSRSNSFKNLVRAIRELTT